MRMILRTATAIDTIAAAHHNEAMTTLPTMTSIELRAIREELGLQQNEAPPLLGVALNTYARWGARRAIYPRPAVILARKYRDEHRKLQI
jgi:DNA-binding transcriptional regulator YiaG